MRCTPAPLWGAALAFLLLNQAPLTAELIPWSYAWSSTPSEVFSDTGTGKLSLTNEDLKSVAGSSDIVATNIATFSTAGPGQPDVFTNEAYTLTLTLVDDTSGDSGTMTFTGEFSGTLAANSSNITNVFTGETEKSIILGTNKFTVSIGPFSSPGPTGSSNLGSIAAHAEVKVESIIQTVPEPSTLLLSGIGLVALLSQARSFRQRKSTH